MRVEFTADAVARTEGDFVVRTGKIFEAGSYPDKGFSLSPDEMAAASRNHKPARLNVEHMPTLFDLGDLGRVERVWEDGANLFADVPINKHVDAYMQQHNIPLKVSAEWNRQTKTLDGLALVRNPRIADAALYASFSAGFAERKAIQRMHDMAADMGAECGGKTLFAAIGDAAEFMTQDELKALQHVHDHCAKNGADCDAYATRKQMYFSDGRTVNTANAEGKAAGDSGRRDKPMTKWEKFSNGLKALFGDAGIDVEAEVPAGDGKIGGNGANPVDFSQSEAYKQMQAQINKQNAEVARLRSESIAKDAEACFNEALHAGKAVPAERDSFIAAFTTAAQDDESNPLTVTFGKDANGSDVQGSRLDVFKAQINARISNGLLGERMQSAPSLGVMFSQEKTGNAADEGYKEGRAYAESLNRRGGSNGKGN